MYKTREASERLAFSLCAAQKNPEQHKQSFSLSAWHRTELGFGRRREPMELPSRRRGREVPPALLFCGGLSFCLGALRLFTGDIFLGRWVSVQSFPDVQKSPSFPPRREPSRSIFCRPSYSAWPAFPPPLRAGPRCNERGARPADSGLLRDALPSAGRAVTHAGKADAAGPASVPTPAHIPYR